ncbi:MAG TPA: nuclear transport factor 2 family protein [Solirubrobacterales bacterium]|nr:nuclear transport factor 2 family protein [Solirubrobacterales bacterium]
MATTAIPTELAAARERNEAIWRQSSTSLYDNRIDEFLAYWHEDARYEVAYPIGDFPAVVEGRAALGELFASFAAASERLEVHDVRFHQTDDPQVAFVEERMVAELVGGGRYENRLVIRVTFRDGLIAEMCEYYGQRAHEELLVRLGVVAARSAS